MRQRGKAVLGLVLTVALLAWVLRDVSAGEVLREVRRADPLLFLLALVLWILGFWVRAWRWGVLLRPAAVGASFSARLSSTVLGFAANNVIPARVGEVLRAYALSRTAAVPVVSGVATLVVERLFDGVVLLALLVAVVALPSFPATGAMSGLDPRAVAGGAGGLFLLVLVFLLFLVYWPKPSLDVADALAERLLPKRFRASVRPALHSFLGGLAVFRAGRLLLLSLLLGLAQWLLGGLSYWLAFRAFGIVEVPFSGALFLQSLVAFASAIPSSPGFFGPSEAAAKVALSLWGVGSVVSVSFALSYHIGIFLPVTLWGAYYAWRLDLGFQEARRLPPQAATEPPPAR